MAAAAASATASSADLTLPPLPSPPPPPPTEVPQWLKSLPLAPEYHPTLAEFQDPIAYILKIEKEASSFGICKIVPPLPAPPRKTTVANLNRSFAARETNPKKPPTFTTRQQQIGFCPRRSRPVQKPVWQSGENYTLQQFETKAKQFERAYLKKAKKATANLLSPLEIETLFWKACADKPFSVEYANDMPGSGFGPLWATRRWRGVEEEEEAANVGETAWNMRGVSRAKGSLLRYMREEIPGVTSPMVYVAMMFSWFAWHVEDHELHSMNYLHMGAGKTWYGVPRDAALAFEEVVRVHGYGGEVNRLVTFALLGEKTTIMTPEVLTGAGIPCCRLVQNAGEFVVTFPGSYHTGFSLGFNCGEAANIATSGWLRVAKEAAIRRASINYPPMVSHFQLLYELALSLCKRMPRGSRSEPRSSRLKDKMKGEGEEMVKNTFVWNVIQNNHLLGLLLDKGSSCIILPRKAPDSPLCSNSLVRSQVKAKPRLSFGLCSHQEAMEASTLLPSDDITPGWNAGTRDMSGLCSLKGNSVSVCQGKMISSATCNKFGAADFHSSSSDSQKVEGEKEGTLQGDGLLDQGLLSCVTCGILSYACVAVLQPKEAAAKYLMSADCGILSGHINGSGEVSGFHKDTSWKTDDSNLVSGSGQIGRHTEDAVGDYWVHCSTYSGQVSEQSVEVFSDNIGQRGISALDLLASAYGDTSDTEEDVLPEKSACTDENDIKDSPSSCKPIEHPNFAIELQNLRSSKDSQKEIVLSLDGADCQDGTFAQDSHNDGGSDDPNRLTNVSAGEKCQLKLDFCGSNEPENAMSAGADSLDDHRKITSTSSLKSMEEPMDFSYKEADDGCPATETAENNQSNMKMGIPSFGSEDHIVQLDVCCDFSEPTKGTAIATQSMHVDTRMMNSGRPVMRRCDKDSSRMHVFCLEHAVEVEKQLQPVGGVRIMLFCHPHYPKIEAEAKLLAEELGNDYTWKDVHFKEATEEEQERFRAALEDEEAIPGNSDWAVKLGINLYYSANLSKSPLYSKQMPYNAVTYKAFGCNSPGSSPVKPRTSGRRPGRQKKIVVVGRWCGKVWMSNQVHPYLAHRNEAQEHDHVEQLYSQCTGQKPKVKTDTKDAPSERNPPASDGTAARNSGKKRKKPLRKVSKKKPRRTHIDESEAVEDVPETCSSPCGRVLRSNHSKHAEITSRKKFNLKDQSGGPSTRLRKRGAKAAEEVKTKSASRKQARQRKAKKAQATNLVTKDEDGEYTCDIEGCSMSFSTKQDLSLHKRDICPVKGCGKKFFSHKYLVQHRKVHMDDRPLECPWKGCKMTFKWAWARTEHIRVHTGDRPYVCREPGCGQTFRFVSDFSRHKRKTGHSIKKGRR